MDTRERLTVVQRLSAGFGACRVDSLPCGPFRRADPLWTHPGVPRDAVAFHCPFPEAEPLLRPRFDGRNLYKLAGTSEVAALPGGHVGFDGVVFQPGNPGRLFAFAPEAGVLRNLRYLARFRDLEIEPGGGALSLAGFGALTASPDIHYEWRTADDPEAYAGLRAVYDANQCRDVREGTARRSRHARLASLVCKRGYVYYYHVTHVLPLLCRMRPLLLAEPDIQILAAPGFEEHFALAEIHPDRLVPYDPSTLYEADQLYAATPVPLLAPPRELLRLTRETFTAGLPAAPGCVVFIRRTPAQRTAFRNRVCEQLGLRARVDVCVLLNHDEILLALRARFPDSEVVDFDADRFTLDDQIALFARARLVVGAHGSGLANLVFARPGTQILELMPERSFFPLFWHLAQALDMPYAVHVVPGVSKYENFAVPPEEVAAAATALTRL